MQKLGINVIRSYNVDGDLNHDECASIFNSVGIYMILDVNSPLPGGSIDRDNPGPSYNLAYLNRTFAIVDAFRGYPNTLGFFGANELINNPANAAPDPPYIRAVQRDLKQYIAARGGRTIPVGYSATDVYVPDTSAYLQCSIQGETNDISRSDFFGLNSYSWCGAATFQTSGYDVLANSFVNSTIPAFFSEYGCNNVEPRVFSEVQALYGPNMTDFSGGLVYEWTQGITNFGLVQVHADNSAQLLVDYNNLQAQYGRLNLTLLQSSNSTARNLKPPICSAGLLPSGSVISTNFTIPIAPAGVEQLIRSGINGNIGSIISVTQTSVQYPVTNVQGSLISNLVITPVANNVANTPSNGAGTIMSTSAASTTGTSAPTTAAAVTGTATQTGAAATTSSKAAAVALGPRTQYAGLSIGSLVLLYFGYALCASARYSL